MLVSTSLAILLAASGVNGHGMITKPMCKQGGDETTSSSGDNTNSYYNMYVILLGVWGSG
jgi:hypothetical protein